MTSNDQAWIEQKNGSVVRRFAGHDRYSGQVAGQTMAYLYEALRLYVNFFQPSFKLIDKTRDGATTVKRYTQPATPCDRLIQHDATGDELKALLNEYRAGLDPVLLLHTIREAQSALVAATSPAYTGSAGNASREKASSVSSPSCPVCGVRVRSALPTRRKCERRGTGGPVKIPSRVFGATCWCGCRSSRMSTGKALMARLRIETPGPFHRGAVANHATPGEGVAQHYVQEHSFMHRPAQGSAAAQWTTGTGAGWSGLRVLKFR